MPRDASRGFGRGGVWHRPRARRRAKGAGVSSAVPVSGAPCAPLLTAVLWMAALGVGAVGLFLEPGEPSHPAPAPAPPPPPVRRIEVPLSAEAESADPGRADPESAAAARVSDDRPPAAPPVSAMAEGSSVAFAVPVSAPARIVGKGAAAGAPALAGAPGEVAVGAGPARVAKLTFGQGAGLQPAPAYPREAVREEREGSVTVRFAVRSDGSVMVARAVASSGHAALDEAALTTIRRRWHFPPGAPRVYEVEILFRLER